MRPALKAGLFPAPLFIISLLLMNVNEVSKHVRRAASLLLVSLLFEGIWLGFSLLRILGVSGCG